VTPSPFHSDGGDTNDVPHFSDEVYLLLGLIQCQLHLCCVREYRTVPILPSSSSSTVERLDSPPLRVTSSSGGYDVTTDHVTRAGDQLNATTPALRFRLADDSFYEWIADGGGGGDVSRRLLGKSSVARFWHRWLERNWTMLPNASSDGDYDSLLAALDADAVSGTESTTDLRQEDVTVSWMYSTKTVVQLLSSPLVGFTVHRYVI